MDFTFQPNISTHALLAESDKGTYSSFRQNNRISIHALLAESDRLSLAYPDMIICTFLSTLSLRRATIPLDDGSLFEVFLSTLSLRRATFLGTFGNAKRYISIHALLAESD